MPRRSLQVVLVATLLAACGGEELDTSLQIPRDYAKFRLLALVDGAPRLDTVVTNGNLPPAAVGLVASPGVSAFRAAHAGDVKAFVSKDGATLARLEAKVDKDALYTIVAAGPSDAVTARLEKESFAPSADKARVRFVSGQRSLEVASATLDGASIASSPPFAALGAWADVTAGAPVLELRTATALVGRFTLPALAAGDVRTLVLVPGSAFSPSQLLVVSEKADGAFTTQLLDLDGTNKPKARLRFVHAATGVNAVDVEASAAVAQGLAAKTVSPTVEVEIDSELVVRADGAELARQALTLTEAKSYSAVLMGNPAAGGPGVRVVVVENQTELVVAPRARLLPAVGGMPGTLEFGLADGTSILPKASYGVPSAYVDVPAGPIDVLATLEVSFGGSARRVPLASVAGLAFPADHAATVVTYGAFSLGNQAATPPVPPSFTGAVLVLDDVDGQVLSELEVTPIAPPQPQP